MRWVFTKYWRRGDRSRLEFSTPAGLRLVRHADIPIKRHTKVRGNASPYDGNLSYWATRLQDHPLTMNRVAILLRRQRGTCARCGLLLTDKDIMEVDHVHPRCLGGRHDWANMQVLHRHCHDRKTAEDGSLSHRSRRLGIHDKDHVAEEPDDLKGSSPVLKTSHRREEVA